MTEHIELDEQRVLDESARMQRRRRRRRLVSVGTVQNITHLLIASTILPQFTTKKKYNYQFNSTYAAAITLFFYQQ